MPIFSDWRGLPTPDYSTNVPVSDFYTGGKSAGLRYHAAEEINSRAIAGDTLIFGADGYALTEISINFFPEGLISKNFRTLLDGGVCYFRVSAYGDSLLYFVQIY